MQLIKIKTIPIEYDIKIENARLVVADSEPARINQKSTPLRVTHKTENAKMRMDSSAMRSSIGMKTPADVAREAPAKTQQTANSVTTDFVQQGNAMTEQGMTIGQYMKQKMLNDMKTQTAITSVPSAPVDISWEPATIETNVQKSEVDMSVQRPVCEMEFIPSSYSLEIKQLAEVEIEYIGGFQYVPPSSDPDYEEK